MNWFDKILLPIAPGWVSRRQVDTMNAYTNSTRLERMRERHREADEIERMYEGATMGRRGKTFSMANNQSANKEINKYQAKLRERSRYLFKNTTTGKRSVRVMANNVIGLGITPTPSGPDAFVKKVKAFWEEWAEETVCDWNGKMNFYGLQKLADKTVSISGECFVLRRRVASGVNKIGLQLMLIEPEFLDSSKSEEKKGGGFIQNGIEYDADGKITGYWFFTIHPDIRYTQSKFFGREDVAHVYEIDRPGQDRGVPDSAATMLSERDLDDYKDAEIMSKKTSAAYAGMVVTPDPDKLDENHQPDDYDDLGGQKLEPGTIYKLYPGEDIRFSTPPMSQGFESFVRVYQRDIAAGRMLTYEQMTGDYSQVNFSSGRMGFIEGSRNVDDRQWNMHIPMFCKVVYGWFVDAVKTYMGIKTVPEGFKVAWTTPRREMLDPVKEMTALKEALAARLISWQEAIRQASYMPDDVFKELQEDYKRFKDSGIEPNWMVPEQPKQLPPEKDNDDEKKPAK